MRRKYVNSTKRNDNNFGHDGNINDMGREKRLKNRKTSNNYFRG